MTDSGQEVVAAIDVGGTRIKAALVDRALGVRAASVTTTPVDLAQTLPETVDAIIADLMVRDPDNGFTLAGCGVVVPGLVDEAAGVGVFSANLGWRDLPIRAPLADRLDVPVTVGHDVRAGLLAETSHGQAKNRRHALFLPVGTGIAGALMVDRRILVADGWAGELGHIQVDPDGRTCGCGSRGCLETVSSATAIQRTYAQRCGRSLGTGDIAHLVDSGNLTATAVWQSALAALARVIVTTVAITGVDVVVIGGGLSECGSTLMDPLESAVHRGSSFHRPIRLARAHFGDRAGTIGAALLAWEKVP